MYVIFADFSEYIGLREYRSSALSAAGIGDLIGRFGGGILAVHEVWVGRVRAGGRRV